MIAVTPTTGSPRPSIVLMHDAAQARHALAVRHALEPLLAQEAAHDRVGLDPAEFERLDIAEDQVVDVLEDEHHWERSAASVALHRELDAAIAAGDRDGVTRAVRSHERLGHVER